MKNSLILIIIFFFISNCNLKPNIDHHGVHMLEIKNEKLIINEFNRNDVIKILGPPSVTSSFDNDILFYIERKITTDKIYKLGKRNIIKNNVLMIEIDNTTTQEVRVPFRSKTKMQCNKAVNVNQGIKDTFSTGSQNQNPPHPNS